MNKITWYKGRGIDYSREVMVYRNRRRRHPRVYSIMQDGVVVAHASQLAMGRCKFIINEPGRKRALKTGVRNVHAFIKGFIRVSGVMGTSPDKSLNAKIVYTPKEGFVCRNLTQSPIKVSGAMGVILNQDGVTGAYLNEC